MIRISVQFSETPTLILLLIVLCNLWFLLCVDPPSLPSPVFPQCASLLLCMCVMLFV